jgi:hypothetical protein
MEDSQSVPYRTASGRRITKKEKVNETKMNNPVGTVSGGSWMEREIEPIKAAKTPRVYRIGRPLGGE